MTWTSTMRVSDKDYKRLKKLVGKGGAYEDMTLMAVIRIAIKEKLKREKV